MWFEGHAVRNTLALGGYYAVKTPYFINPAPRPYGGNPLCFLFCPSSSPPRQNTPTSFRRVRSQRWYRETACAFGERFAFSGQNYFSVYRYGSGVRTVPLVLYENFRRKLFVKPVNSKRNNATFKVKLDCKLKKKINNKNIKIPSVISFNLISRLIYFIDVK